MKRQISLLAIILLLPMLALASEVESILQGLEQLIFAGVVIIIVVLVPIIVYLIKRKKSIAMLLYIIGGISTFAGLLMGSSRGQEIQAFGTVLIILGLLNIIIPILLKPTDT